ncbi:AfsR/SARP family transcriptional regulator [Tropicibacter naphthalenivorans]|uniref:AfsR/SARP family transcriptional regulator n=1 Tax=Tropicibacter naphthalenivorans TaxID=441103 RepID=UPI00071C6162|nr:bacterial transcriptional activator domain-containing protein [Tropicibacter naphthalenivorans]
MAYLAWKCGARVGRERLTEALWPDLPPKRALRALNTSLWRIRRAIRAANHRARVYLVTSGTDVMVLGGDHVRSDVAEVEQLSAEVLALTAPTPSDAAPSDLAPRVEAALAQHSGPFLPEVYDDWSHPTREMLRMRYAVLQEFVVQTALRCENWPKARLFAGAILAEDPLNETAHQWLIRCSLATGDLARARAQYDTCKDVLHRELGVAPLPETTALFDTRAAPRMARAPHRAAGFRRALDKLDAARAALIRLQADI